MVSAFYLRFHNQRENRESRKGTRICTYQVKHLYQKITQSRAQLCIESNVNMNIIKATITSRNAKISNFDAYIFYKYIKSTKTRQLKFS